MESGEYESDDTGMKRGRLNEGINELFNKIRTAQKEKEEKLIDMTKELMQDVKKYKKYKKYQKTN